VSRRVFSRLARYFGEMDSEDDLRRAEELVAEGGASYNNRKAA
jgi:hypothetical protein